MQVKWYFPLLHMWRFSNKCSSPAESGSVSSSSSSMMKIYLRGVERLEYDYNLSFTTFSSMELQVLEPPYDKLIVNEVGFKVPFFSVI